MQTPQTWQIEQFQDVAVIRPKGDLGRQHEATLAELFSTLLNRNRHKVVLNFSDVDHVHYSVLAKLNHTRRLFQQCNGDLFFAEATPYLKKIFQVVEIDVWERVFDSMHEALFYFADQPPVGAALH